MSLKSLNNPKTQSYSLYTPCVESLVKAERRPSCQQGITLTCASCSRPFMIPSFHFQPAIIQSSKQNNVVFSFRPTWSACWCCFSRNRLRRSSMPDPCALPKRNDKRKGLKGTFFLPSDFFHPTSWRSLFTISFRSWVLCQDVVLCEGLIPISS